MAVSKRYLAMLLIAVLVIGTGPPVFATMSTGQYESDLVYSKADNQYLLLYRNVGASSEDVYGKFVTYDGTAVGSAYQISDGQTSVSNPRGAYNSSEDEYLVVWTDMRNDVNSVFGSIIDGEGNVVKDDFAITNSSTPEALEAVAYSSASNSYMVIYEYEYSWSQPWLKGIPVAADGTVGSPFVISENMEQSTDADMAYNQGNDSFGVVWDRKGPSTIYGAVFRPDGSTVTPAYAVSEGTGSDYDPAVAADTSTGKALIVWEESSNGSEYLAGNLVSESASSGAITLEVVSSVSYTDDLRITYNPVSQNYLLTWIDTENNIVKGQYVSESGSPTGDTFDIASYTSSITCLRAGANRTGDNYLVSYTNYPSNGDPYIALEMVGNPAYGTLAVGTETLTTEESGTVTVPVKRTGGLDGDVSVNYSTVIGTAGTSDFTSASGTLTFANGVSEAAINISITEDHAYEGTESFTVELDTVSGAALGIRTTTISITDDDAQSVLKFPDPTVSVNETDGTATLTVERSVNVSGESTVDYATNTGTAGTADFTTTSGTLTFTDGETAKTITISITDDSDYEASETFTVELSNPSSNATLGTSTASVTIQDPEDQTSNTVAFSSRTYTVHENESPAEVTVVRTGETTETATVEYATVAHGEYEDSATEGVDYTATSGTLTFAQGETSKTIKIPVVYDNVVENDEYIYMYLSNPSGVELGEIYSIEIAIYNVAKDEEDEEEDTSTAAEDTTTIDPDEQTKEQVDTLKDELRELADLDAVDTDQATTVIETIEKNIDTIQDSEQLEQAVKTYVDTIDTIGDISEKQQDKQWAGEKVVKSAETLTKAVRRIENNDTVVEIADSYVQKLTTLKAEQKVENTVQLKQAVEQVAKSVTQKVSEVRPVFSSVTVDKKTDMNINVRQFTEAVTKATEQVNAVKRKFEEYYGEENIRDFEVPVTLVADRVNDQVEVRLNKEVLDVLDQTKVDRLGVKVGGTSIALSATTVQEVRNANQSLSVDMKFSDQTFDEPQQDLTFKSGYTTDVNVFVENNKKEVLDKPVELSFDLDQFSFFEAQYDPSFISVFRLNEDTAVWEPVGGVYDPVTNTVRTRRITLSQYTVMQSNKTFTDVETSWAKNDINELLSKGIVDEQVTFSPQDNISREEFTTWVTRAYGLTDQNASAPFGDIQSGSEHYSEIASAFNQGIISGRSASEFDPEGTITRQEMAVILSNALEAYDNKRRNAKLTEDLAELTDGAEVANWADDEMALMIELGLFEAEAGAIDPNGTVSKELAASILKKIYG